MEDFLFDPPSSTTVCDLNADSFVSVTGEFESSWETSEPEPISMEEDSNELSSTLKIKWSNIVARFEREFALTFSKSKKAHFDCLPKDLKVVDGARARWFPLLLLDALIFILHNNYFRFATRRAFNQLEVLYDCILEEVKISHPIFFEKLQGLDFQEGLSWPVEQSATIYEDTSEEEEQAILSREEDSNLLISFACAAKFPGLEIEDIAFPWGSIEELKGRMIEDPPSKSKQKFLAIIDYLSRHHSFTHHEFSFPDLLRAAVCKVLAYFGSNRSVLLPTVPLSDSPKWESAEEASSPPLNTSPGLHEKLLFSSLVKSSSLDIEELKLPPVATVIARPCIRRKKSPRAKRNIKIKKGNYTGVNRAEIAYSSYPPDSTVIPTFIPNDAVEPNDPHSSFINPFLYEEQELRQRVWAGSVIINHGTDQIELSCSQNRMDSLSSSNDQSWDAAHVHAVFPVDRLPKFDDSCFEEEKNSFYDSDDLLVPSSYTDRYMTFSSNIPFPAIPDPRIAENCNTKFSLKVNSCHTDGSVNNQRSEGQGFLCSERDCSQYPITAFSAISKTENLEDVYLERICASVDGTFNEERKLEVDSYSYYYQQPLLPINSVSAHYRREREDFQSYYNDELIPSVDRKQIQ
mmetsp:Transcript_15820/g.17129  ORF Transcript_15820/g.17129 Transcript_15820/m.17129 type:complete len:632 (+) Transcript_15820:365-2260(+)|eukprot:CAMPEP_0173157038 /NCGR_PEP_ID=MMETSP1105-20130129/15289_1 /TAXON_ID=2985 /ORGANISM="Ochromonas sp., Strain BG-1" /LENGTH=631 /DNA_ID=CAMNT_0014074231 /DNA_START=251 /DNA_END=2146 /DNA_ORIENTATION=-